MKEEYGCDTAAYRLSPGRGINRGDGSMLRMIELHFKREFPLSPLTLPFLAMP